MTTPNIIFHQMLGTEGGKDNFCTRKFMAKKMKCVCQVEDVITTKIYERKKRPAVLVYFTYDK